MYLIKITSYSEPCFVADLEDGDPPRTLLVGSAQRFDTKEEASRRIAEVKKSHPLKTHTYSIENENNFK